MDKEEAKLRYKREMLQKREERLRNPRSVVMGIDSNALDSQIADKRCRESAQKEADLQESIQHSIIIFLSIFNYIFINRDKTTGNR